MALSMAAMWSNASLMSFTFYKTASTVNLRRISHNYISSPINLTLVQSPLHRTSILLILLTKPLVRKRYCRIRYCSSCHSPSKTLHGKTKLSLALSEAVSDDELQAAANLRVRIFYEFKQSYRVEEHRRYMSELEFEALKKRIAGKHSGFKRVACVIATIPISEALEFMDDLCSSCKAVINGEERVVVGTLDLNQSNQLPDEIGGTRPKGYAADFTRAYLTNVCVAKELQRKGIGRALVMQSVKIAQQWDMTDLYVHVAVDNDAARCLYEKSGFIYESEEPAWRARFLDRPRRCLLWASMDKLLLM